MNWITKMNRRHQLAAAVVCIVLGFGFCREGAQTRTPASVHVSGYTRSDGTYVRPYNRRPPGSVARDAATGNFGLRVLGFISFGAASFFLLARSGSSGSYYQGTLTYSSRRKDRWYTDKKGRRHKY